MLNDKIKVITGALQSDKKNNSKICQVWLWAKVLFEALRTHAMEEEVNFRLEKVVYSKTNTNWKNKRCSLFQKCIGFPKGLIKYKEENRFGFPSLFVCFC